VRNIRYHRSGTPTSVAGVPVLDAESSSISPDRRCGVLEKRLIVDLFDVEDPDDIGGPLVGIPDDAFNFPLQSVESVTPVDDFTLLVGLDNNGRVPGTPDGTEIITLRSRVPLRTLRVEPCKDASNGAHNGQEGRGPKGCR